MILSKGNLQVVLVTKDDKNIPVLDNVYVAPDGSTVGSNGRVMLAVSPVKKKVEKSVPLEAGTVPEEGVVLPSSFIKAVMRDIPKDREFGGLLEHLSVRAENGEPEVTVKITDGKRAQSIKGRRFPREYIDYLEVFRNAFSTRKRGVRTVLNLKRLLSLLNAVDKICDDRSGELPVYLEFAEDGTIIVRATDFRTAQDVVGVMSAYHGIEGEWKKMSVWERLLSKAKTMVKKSSCEKRT